MPLVVITGGMALAWLLATFLGLFARVPWSRLAEVAQQPEFRDALGLSLRTCLISTLIVFLVGLPLALWIGQSPRLAPILRVLVILPMTLPPVVAGLALLATFGRRGLVGAHLSVLGIEIGFTTAAVVMAQVFVAFPYFVVAVESAIRVLDPAPGAALGFLGARPGSVLRYATLPALAPAISSGLALAFARALGEFGATLTFAGSLQGTTRTMPLAIYLARESDPETAYALALVLIITAVLAIGLGQGLAHLLSKPRPSFGRAPAAAAEPGVPLPLVAQVDRPERGVSVTLEVPAGQTVALVGPNGSGKSTVLEAAALAEPGRALLTQDPALLVHLSARDNVALGPRVQGKRRDQARTIAHTVLSEVGASGLAGRGPSEMSGGQRARVALARALATRPGVLLLDEPTAALDVTSAREMRDVVGQLLRTRTAVIATHNPLDIARLTERVVVLEGGAVVEDGPTAAVMAAPQSSFAQALFGVNRLAGTVEAGDRGWTLRVAGSSCLIDDWVHPPGAVAAYFTPMEARVSDEPVVPVVPVENLLVLPGEVEVVAPSSAGSLRLELRLVDGQRCIAEVPATRAADVHTGTLLSVAVAAPRLQPADARVLSV
ncbi:MAG TPA: ATP-binding cassette domain-containing protein [Actinomycetaceae bacterium]|nr:ATP-binding cassette domain-containing protein [Actinomycetaceae bacterium]